MVSFFGKLRRFGSVGFCRKSIGTGHGPLREDTLSTLITVPLHDQVACLALEDI